MCFVHFIIRLHVPVSTNLSTQDSSEISMTVLFPASPKTALSWDFFAFHCDLLRNRWRLADLLVGKSILTACSDCFQKSERAYSAAPPFQIEPASLGFDLALGADLKAASFLSWTTLPNLNRLLSVVRLSGIVFHPKALTCQGFGAFPFAYDLSLAK